MGFNVFKKLRAAFPGAAAPAAEVPAGSKTWEQERDDFFKALSTSDTAVLTATVQKYPDALEWRNQKGEKALFIAMDAKKTDVFRLLLDLGADVNQKEVRNGIDNDQPVVAVAGRCGNKDVVRLLLERGADPHAVNSGWSVEKWATFDQTNYDIADMIKRGDKIRAEYLASQPAQPAPVPAATPAASGSGIAVLPPIKLKANQTPAATA